MEGASLLLHWLESRWAGHSITTRGHSCTTAGLLPGSQAQGKVGQAGRLGCLGSCCGGPGLPWEEPPRRRGVKMDPRLSDSEKTTPPYTAYLPGSAKRDQLGTAAISEIILPFAVGEGYPPRADLSPSRAPDSMPVYVSPLLIIFREKRRTENSTEGPRGPHLGTGATLIPTFSQEHGSCGLGLLKPFFSGLLGHSFPFHRMGLKSFGSRLLLWGAWMRKLRQTAESRLKQKREKRERNWASPLPVPLPAVESVHICHLCECLCFTMPCWSW